MQQMNPILAETKTEAELQRKKISAFIVCFNEEGEIEACLESLSFCDEVVVIDSFSSDRTVEICNAFGARVIQREWPGYRAQKAFGLSSCQYDWVVNLDADERVTEELQEAIIGVLRRKWQIETGHLSADVNEPEGYQVNRVVFYLGRWWRKGGWYPEYRVRFFRKACVTWGGVDPHEKPIVSGPIDTLAGELSHYTYRTMDDQIQRLHAHASIAAIEESKRGRKASIVKLLFNPLTRFWKFYFVKRGYREGVAGLIVAGMEGFYTFIKYAKLWKLITVIKFQMKREMSTDSASLLSILDRFPEAHVGVIGDLILDHYIWGEVSRISPEAPVVVVNVSREDRSLGGAANVVNNLNTLGAKVSVVGTIGTDENAKILRDHLTGLGVDVSRVLEIPNRPTTAKTRVIARAQQVVRVDRESTEPLDEELQAELTERVASLADDLSGGLIVSDYAKGVVSESIYRPLSERYVAGRFSLAGSPLLVDPKNDNFLVYKGASVVKPNRSEAEVASGVKIKTRKDGIEAAKRLVDIWECESVLVTLGDLGMVSYSRDASTPEVEIETEAREVYDVSGAGDTVAAVYTLALTVGGTLEQAARLANVAAGIVVAEIGAVGIKFEQLKAALIK